MKKKKLMDMIGLADEKYVSEADPDRCMSSVTVKVKREKKPFSRKKWISIAACLLVAVTALNMVLFIPYGTNPPSVEKYKDSEYYSIIQKLNTATYRQPRYKNNFAILQNGFFKVGVGADALMPPMNSAPTGEGINPGDKYEEITDNQVAGVTEADRIKRSDKYIYYLANTTLYVYSINGEKSELVGAYTIQTYVYGYQNEWEFYLSEDCKTVTVVVTYYDDEKNSACVSLVSLDVSDPENIFEKGRITVVGGYVSTRVVDGKLLLVTNFRVSTDNNGRPNFDDEFSFIPSIDRGNGFEILPIEDIIVPETLSATRYTVVCKLDEDTLDFEDATALLSYSEEIYVSADKIFATRAYTAKEEPDGIDEYYVNKSMTDISVLSYNEPEMKHLGTVTVEGYVKDQYSLDEYEGVLRVVTTTNATYERKSSSNYGVLVPSVDEIIGTSASLYCISLESYEVISSVLRFAPRGETVRSVRFDGTDAYVCTAVQLTDPVFFFDLSDMDNITYKETGTIEGFSTSLVNFGNGYLLGIGVGDSVGTLKIEIYEESESGVVSVCAYELPNTEYSENYKSYYINREKQMIGLAVNIYGNGKYGYDETYRYLLLGFDGYKIREILNVELPGYQLDSKRGVLIDGFMYLFSQDVFKVLNIYDPYEAQSLNLEYADRAVVTTLPEGKEYVFDEYGAMKIVDYLNRLSLISNFSEDPNEYAGMTYEILLKYGDGSVTEIYHMGNTFLLVKNRSVYMMDASQAAQFEDLIESLAKE